MRTKATLYALFSCVLVVSAFALGRMISDNSIVLTEPHYLGECETGFVIRSERWNARQDIMDNMEATTAVFTRVKPCME